MAESSQTDTTVISSGRTTLHPFVAYGVCALLLAASVGVLYSSPDKEGELLASPEFTAATAFFVRNPDVEMDDWMAKLIGREFVAEARAAHAKKRDTGGVAFLSDRIRSKSQKRFDGLQQEALQSLDQLPNWRFGVGATSPLSNWLTHLTVHETVLSLGISMVFFTFAAIALEGAWGSLLFGSLLLLLPILSAGSYRIIYSNEIAPWAGPSAVVAALLGAYLIRSFKGFVVPGWLVVPLWIVAEYLLARDISIPDFDTTPVVMHAIGFGFGAAAALVISATGLEDAFARRETDSADLVSNPVLDAALEVSEKGDSDAAFSLLEQELQRSPANYDVAVALWELARRIDRSSGAVPALLGAIRATLRSGQREQATALWNAMMVDVRDPKAESTLLVRIGEALIAEGDPEPGLVAFGLAIDSPRRLSSVLAIRIVRAAQPLDPALARRAAELALVDDHLEPRDRRQLQVFVESAGAASAGAVEDPGDGLRESDVTSQEPALAATPESPVSDIAPAPGDAAVESAAPTIENLAEDLQRAAFANEGSTDLAGDVDPYQDPHAIAVDQFEEVETPAAEPADPETWNQPDTVEDLSSELEDVVPALAEAGEVGDVGGLAEDTGFDWDGLSDDLGSALAAEEEEAAAVPVEAKPETPAPDGDSTETTETTETFDPGAVSSDPLAGESFEDGLALEATHRILALREAVPVALDAAGVSCEVEGVGKTTLPFDRIDAVSVAAVEGLSDKPVILVDLVLNWMDTPDAALKVIRFRSDGFDPRRLCDNAQAIGALRDLLEKILVATGATPLPSPAAARGTPFDSFSSLAEYQESCLHAQPA